MGGMTPVISRGLGIAGAISGLAGGMPGLALASQLFGVYDGVTRSSQKAEQAQAMRQLQAAQALEQKNLAAQVGLERQKIAQESAQSDQERRAALRRAVARQRANFASQGVSGGASAEAVLLGLFDESDDEREKRAQTDALKYAALDQKISQNQSLNLLQQQQLRERSRLERLF